MIRLSLVTIALSSTLALANAAPKESATEAPVKPKSQLVAIEGQQFCKDYKGNNLWILDNCEKLETRRAKKLARLQAQINDLMKK